MLLVVPAYADNATITGDSVNFRSGPGINYEILGRFAQGAVVNVTNKSNASWYEIVFNNQTGYISSNFLSFDTNDNDVVLPSSNAVTPTPSATATPAPTATVAPTATPMPTSNGNANPSSSSAPSSVVSYSTDKTSDSQTIVDTSSANTTKTGYINAMYVRFRTGPSTTYSVINTYSKYKTLEITGTSGDWTSCTIDGVNGYVCSTYVSEGSPTNASPSPSPSAIISSTPSPSVSPTPSSTPTPTPTIAPSPTVESTSSVQGYISGDYVRFRTGPSTSYSIITQYNKGQVVTITGQSGDWKQCTINGVSGFVSSQYVKESSSSSSTETSQSSTESAVEVAVTVVPVDNKAGYISGNNVRFRSGPSTDSSILGEFYFANAVTITGTSGDWTQVSVNGQKGYVYSQYVKEGTYSITSSTSSSTTTSSSVKGTEVVNYAMQYLGYKYTWGGKDPSTGFDCSGLVYYVYQHFGVTLNRVAADQAENGTHVDSADLQPGDILCFYSSGNYIGHAGIYIGDNKFIHAATYSTGVIITEISGTYAERGFEARRIFTD